MTNGRAFFARQLHAQLPHWVAQGWIDAAQAERLAAQYPVVNGLDRRQHWQVLLSVLAVLCMGGGVIALFAANWHELSRPLRVVLSLAPLLLSQAAFLYARARKPYSALWREGAGLAVAISVGATIALIAQTYHIESSDMFLRTWLWLVLPLPYLTGSWASAFFAGFLMHVFGADEASILPRVAGAPPWEYLVYLAALLPWVWLQARRHVSYDGQSLLWRAFVNTQAIMAIGVLLLLHGVEPLSMLILLAAAYLCSRAWCAGSVMNMLFAYVLGMVYVMFVELVQDVEQVSVWHTAYAVPLLLAALWRWQRVPLWSWCFAGGSIAFYVLFHYLPDGMRNTLWAWGVAGTVIVLGVWQLRLALDEERYLAMNTAFIWMLAVLYMRFVDTDIPLWLKGVVFIVAGMALFALNRYVGKRHQGGAS